MNERTTCATYWVGALLAFTRWLPQLTPAGVNQDLPAKGVFCEFFQAISLNSINQLKCLQGQTWYRRELQATHVVRSQLTCELSDVVSFVIPIASIMGKETDRKRFGTQHNLLFHGCMNPIHPFIISSIITFQSKAV